MTGLLLYLSDMSFSVAIGKFNSESFSIPFGVPQGSILVPLLFNLYMQPLLSTIQKFNVSYHSYADATQLYISVSPTNLSPLDDLFNCIPAIKLWMTHNVLQLNNDKTEVLVVGPKELRQKMYPVLASKSIRNLGVIIDPNLNFHEHILNITKTFYHLRNIAKIRCLLSRPEAEELVHAFISSRLH